MSSPADAGLRPDMEQALADLRELGELFALCGVELIGALTSIAEGVPPHLLGEVLDVPAIGANHAVAHFKLAEHLHRCLAALRAWNGDLHVTHEITPEMIEIGASTILDEREHSTAWDLASSVYRAMASELVYARLHHTSSFLPEGPSRSTRELISAPRSKPGRPLILRRP